MSTALSDASLDRLFRSGRTYSGFLPRPVSNETLRALYDLAKWGPTAFNGQPSRYVFVRSGEAKERLAPALSPSNRDKVMAAPIVVIVANDSRFYEHLPNLSGNPKARELFETNPSLIEPTLLRNGSLQAGYLILAARSLGLDVGPMSGFNAELVDKEFFADGRYRVNLIANLGYGDPASLKPRAPRLSFDDVATIL